MDWAYSHGWFIPTGLRRLDFIYIHAQRNFTGVYIYSIYVYVCTMCTYTHIRSGQQQP